MFQRRKLPPDNHPDNFESRAYHHYRPEMRPGAWLWLRFSLPRLILALALLGMIALGGFVAFMLVPTPEPEVIIITAVPSSDNLPPIGGDFPAGISQTYLNLPARLDNTLDFQEKHAYRFFLEPGITWTITVTPVTDIDPVLSLYSPEGLILQHNNLGAALPVTITYQATVSGQYGIIVETAGGGATAGAYTLTIEGIR